MTEPVLEFHHLGVACADLDKEEAIWAALGFLREAPDFEDENQGVRGRFLVGPGPRLELLADLEGRRTVAGFVERGVRFYHHGFYVDDIDSAIAAQRAKGAKLLRPPMSAIAFDGRMGAFLAVARGVMIELIESGRPKT
jgi:methylmalonyl-CoA/ethylmalonyl-CoA epimerase